MQTQIFDGTATDRAVAALHIHDGTADRVIQRLSVFGPDNVDRMIYSTAPSLSVTLSDTVVVGGSFGSGTITTTVCTATPAGGTGPYTYAWTLIDHTSSTLPTALSPTAAASQFRQTGVAPGGDESATFRMTVTDSLAATATANVTAAFIDYS
jgi:hypothetical protein